MKTLGRDRERRRFPRVRLLRRSRDARQLIEPFVLRDLSVGGFSIESSVPFAVGHVHPFAFSDNTSRVIVLHGIVRHCVRQNRQAAKAVYVAGFEFTRLRAADAAAVARMLRRGSRAAVAAVMTVPSTPGDRAATATQPRPGR